MKASTDHYLDRMAALFCFKPDESFEGEDTSSVDSVDAIPRHIKAQGIELVEVGDAGDGIWYLFDDGELKLTAYITTRGKLYHAGAYDGETMYAASNMYVEAPVDQWRTVDSACGHIAKDGWKEVNTP